MNVPCQGQWWVPASPDRSVFGTLTFTRRHGATLSLADSLSAGSDEPELDIIVGQTAGGAYVTLLHALRTEEPMFRMTSTFPCSYHAPLLITGAAFDSEAEIRFSLWQIRFPELRAWAGKPGPEVDSSELSAGRDSPAVRITYRAPPKQMLLSETDGLDLSLGFWPSLNHNPDVAALRQDVYLEARQASRDTLKDYMLTATRFENVLTLATGSLVRTDSIKAIVRTEEAADHPILVDILYQPVRKAPRRTHPRTQPLFTLPDIVGREDECLNNWFTKAEWLDPICDLYFGTLHNPSEYLDLNFLTFVQALEAYHRRASAETDKPADEHAARIKAILDAASAVHRDWLAEKLTYSNELSLRRRLRLLFSQFSYLTDDLIPDRKATISAIYDNRNYLTHYNAKLTGRAAKGARLLQLVEILKLLLQACFLRELGLPETTIKEFVSRSRSVPMLQHLNNLIARSVSAQ